MAVVVERTLLPLLPRPPALLSSIHSHQHYNSSSHSHSPTPISLTNAFLASLFSSHGLEKRMSHTRKPITILCRIVPARDIVIDFGRHKGKMMGTLPSKYLRWMAKNPVELLTLRFPTQDWAKLAKDVLLDPYYRDRMEWETVEDPWQNTRYRDKRSGDGTYNFLRLATRFGWDLTVSWREVDFKLLGTSKGGRIPRTKDNPNPNLQHDYYLQETIYGSLARSLVSGNTKDRNLVSKKREDKGTHDDDGDENGHRAELLKRREARRERQKARGDGNMEPQLEEMPKDGPLFPGRGALLRKLAEAEAKANTRKWPKM